MFYNQFNIKGKIGEETFNALLVPDKSDRKIGTIGKPYKDVGESTFIHTSLRINDTTLSALYDETKESNKIMQLDNILSIINPQIERSEIASPGGKSLIRLLRKDGESLPVPMFGDAVRKINELMLILLNTNRKAIFIDEIENGLHYTKQADVWKALFTIAKEREIQLFATTHSKEMIEAFAKIGSESENEGQGVYFNMFRSPRSGQIVAAPHKMDILDNKLKRGESLRGEILV